MFQRTKTFIALIYYLFFNKNNFWEFEDICLKCFLKNEFFNSFKKFPEKKVLKTDMQKLILKTETIVWFKEKCGKK